MDERLGLLLMDYGAGRYTRRQFLAKAGCLGVATVAALLEMAGDRQASDIMPAVEAAAPARTVVIGMAEPIVNPDPAIEGSVGLGDIRATWDNLNEGVVRFKNGTVDLEPCLAKSWDISADGLTYTFNLRQALFHDGTPVTAGAVKLSYDRQIDQKNFYHFPGITYTEIVFSDVTAIDAVDPMTLRITQKRPTVILLPNLALFVEGIVSPAALAKYGRDYGMHPTGSGPFQFERWIKGVEFVETAFPQYWGGRPWLDRVVWKVVPENTVRLEQLRTGELDVDASLDFKDIPALRADQRFQVITGTYLDVQYLIMNMHKPPFEKQEVRQALQFAVNKENIRRAVYYGNYTVGAGPVPKGVLGYDQSLEKVYPNDPKRAKDLLAKAGFPNGFPFTVMHRTEGFWPEIAQLVQSDLQEVGLKVTLEGLDQGAFGAKLNAGGHEAALNDWTMDNSDPDNIMFSLFSAPRARVRMGYMNPQVDTLNKDAQVQRDPGKRRQMYVQAQRLILEDAPFLTLGYPALAMGTKAAVRGLLLSPLSQVVMRNVRIA
jgi:peptide/nickel transport system substrate-binding protein